MKIAENLKKEFKRRKELRLLLHAETMSFPDNEWCLGDPMNGCPEDFAEDFGRQRRRRYLDVLSLGGTEKMWEKAQEKGHKLLDKQLLPWDFDSWDDYEQAVYESKLIGRVHKFFKQLFCRHKNVVKDEYYGHTFCEDCGKMLFDPYEDYLKREYGKHYKRYV